jgi:hypothetical protein
MGKPKPHGFSSERTRLDAFTELPQPDWDNIQATAESLRTGSNTATLLRLESRES